MGGSGTHIWSAEHLSSGRTIVPTANHGTRFYSSCGLAPWPYSGTVLCLSYLPMRLVVTGRPSWPLTSRTGSTKAHTSYATDDSPACTCIISRESSMSPTRKKPSSVSAGLHSRKANGYLSFVQPMWKSVPSAWVAPYLSSDSRT